MLQYSLCLHRGTRRSTNLLSPSTTSSTYHITTHTSRSVAALDLNIFCVLIRLQVIRMEVTLQDHYQDSSSVSLQRGREEAGPPSRAPKDPVAIVLDFLKQNKTAKIIYIIDTHSMDNGFLAYTGNTPKNYMACSLEEVRTFGTNMTSLALLTYLRRLSEIVLHRRYSSSLHQAATDRSIITRA